MARSSIDWLEALDLDQAVANCHRDIIGDWYRDPWSWPELDWVLGARPDLIVARFNASGARRPARLDVPKENFGTRPAIVMDPLDRLVYQALVDRCSTKLISHLKPWVFIARLKRRGKRVAGRYARGDREDELYRAQLNVLARKYSYLLVTDVVSFFASIPVPRAIEGVEARAGASQVTDRLASMLEGFDGRLGRTGLPQRFVASSVVANMYLQPIDDVLNDFSGPRRSRRPHYPVARWMDDIWVFGDSESRLRQVQIELEDVMRSLGLNMNVAKTKLLEGEDVETEVRRREHSAVDRALAQPTPDARPLDDLLDAILGAPELADRTSIRFATRRMRRTKMFDRVSEFVDAARKLPHAADILARLFRDAEAWRNLGEWYVEYARSDWALDWAAAQLGTMFPSNEQPPDGVSDFFAERLAADASLPFSAMSAQRLASWDKETGRSAIRARVPRAEHPLMRRALALAALLADEDRSWARGLLTEFEENSVTAEMVRATRRRFSAAADFAGD